MGRDRLAVKIEDLEDEDKVIDDEWGEQEYYILYDGRHQTGKVCEQLLLKMISGIENLQENSSLDLKTASKISVNNYRELTSLMSLFKQEFEQMCKRFFCDFDSQVYYRLIHNMIWSNVDESKVDSYFRIFLHHQKLTFEEIEEDEKFMRKGKNILYVPKEGREGDGTLRSIYEKYLKSKGRRETRDLYDSWLELREDGYYHDNSRINHIIFLCDNFECGTAAVRMLRAYLDIGTNDITDIEKRKREEKELEKVKFRLHKYYLKESASVGAAEESTQTEGKVSQVFLKDVIEKNGCMVEVYGYYGTKEGQNVIDSFLKEQGIAFVPSTFKRRIFSKASQIEKDVQCIWPKMKCGDFYTVVREFNMTKVNVFPPEMLDNPEKAICMFVKKIELSTTR